MKAAALMEWNGTPIDVAGLAELREHWVGIQDDLIVSDRCRLRGFEGRSFRTHLWERWLSPTISRGRATRKPGRSIWKMRPSDRGASIPGGGTDTGTTQCAE